jgi:Flp pilus assembly protein TadG
VTAPTPCPDSHRAVGALRADDRGQATVEFALCLPLVVLLLLLVVQVGVIVRGQVLVTHAAREAARAAAVDADPAAAERAAEASTPLAADRLSVRSSGRAGPGSRVRVDVSYRLSTDVPLVGPMLPDLDLQASATMRVER